jgi:hypothetical protein
MTYPPPRRQPGPGHRAVVPAHHTRNLVVAVLLALVVASFAVAAVVYATGSRHTAAPSLPSVGTPTAPAPQPPALTGGAR